MSKNNEAFVGGVSPWDARNKWIYSIVKHETKHKPPRFKVFAEKVDSNADYRGREIGIYVSDSLAEKRVDTLIKTNASF